MAWVVNRVVRELRAGTRLVAVACDGNVEAIADEREAAPDVFRLCRRENGHRPARDDLPRGKIEGIEEAVAITAFTP